MKILIKKNIKKMSNQQQEVIEQSTWTSWFTFGYLGSSSPAALGRSAPKRDFTAILRSSEGKKFIATSPDELQEVRRKLRKVVLIDKSNIPVAPPAPYNPVIAEPVNYFQELQKKVTRCPAHSEMPSNYSIWSLLGY